jgi:hypothetical protein
VEWKIDGNNFPLGRLGIAKIVGKIAHQFSWKWNFLSTTKNSEWKMGKRTGIGWGLEDSTPATRHLTAGQASSGTPSLSSRTPGWKNGGRKLH